jgi:hypothetical protein
MAGGQVLVVGSAPCPLVVPKTRELVIAVNGGISNVPRADVWMLNSRGTMGEWGPELRALHLDMVRQGQDRTVDCLVMLTKHDDAADLTLQRLRKQVTRYRQTIEIHNHRRRELEAQAGARDSSMTREALSIGLFAVCWAFLNGAVTVRMEGFSWQPGYHYRPGEPFNVRGHKAGDKQALARLLARYPGRLFTSLAKEHQMTSKNASKRSSGGAATKPKTAKAALTPKGERERKAANKKTADQQEAEARLARRSSLRVRATELSFYSNKRWRPGEEFMLREASDFRPSCMEHVDPSEPAPEPSSATGIPPAAPTAAARNRSDNPLGVD